MLKEGRHFKQGRQLKSQTRRGCTAPAGLAPRRSGRRIRSSKVPGYASKEKQKKEEEEEEEGGGGKTVKYPYYLHVIEYAILVNCHMLFELWEQ